MNEGKKSYRFVIILYDKKAIWQTHDKKMNPAQYRVH
jgi:hypothetical protein